LVALVKLEVAVLKVLTVLAPGLGDIIWVLQHDESSARRPTQLGIVVGIVVFLMLVLVLMGFLT